MENFITSINDFLWTYILTVVLIAAGLWFTIKTGFVQFRNPIAMLKLLAEGVSLSGKGKKHHVSSFQAFCISTASRVGTGNMAGVATAIAVGGPGAIFWMWLIAIFSAASAFIEATLAQIYKTKGQRSYIGGPAYYMEKGLKQRWMGIFFAVLITVTFGLVFNSVQSNTITLAFNEAFGFDRVQMGLVVAVLSGVVIFGGIHRIAVVSSVVVPVMALAYVALSLFILGKNIDQVPAMFAQIFESAFGLKQIVGGGLGAALMQGIKRGLFSNEAGMGSAPNAAATAHVSHPVKQGFIQVLGVFTDTLVICSSTAFIVLLSGADLSGGIKGIQLTQVAVSNQVGAFGSVFIAISIFFFAFSSIIGNYYYGEVNMRFITDRRRYMWLYRLVVILMVFVGSILSLDIVWSLADVFMALMALTNLVAIVLLGNIAVKALKDYQKQKRNGVANPTFHKSSIKELKDEDITCW
ncbi:MAG TPA: sodium:alanine symporter family protein [Porphyromonadaceae bacterium]|nr:sodium:alanine symporter family protein [Porphyromonadaceae bacterium]